MAKIAWDATGSRQYETGVDRGVLYVMGASTYGTGVPWNGLTAVTESPSGAEASPFYADNIKYANLMSAEDFGCTIEAYTYPDAFAECDGSAAPKVGVQIGQQTRKTFGFSYRTSIGNDTAGQNAGYKIHVVYGCLAAPSEKNYQTINDSPEPLAFSWEVSTTPVAVTGYKPTATLVIDSTKISAGSLTAVEEALYGKDGTPGSSASLPLPDALLALITP